MAVPKPKPIGFIAIDPRSHKAVGPPMRWIGLTAVAIAMIVIGAVYAWKPTSSLGCAIKGNISFSGERIYHVPGQRYYNATVINGRRGERWFCTEQEAVRAGWRKAKV